MAGLVVGPTDIGERQGRWDLDDIARPPADQIQAAPAGQRVELPFHRPIQRRPWRAGGSAAGMDLDRHVLEVLPSEALDVAERREFGLVVLDVVGIEHRQLDDVVETGDVARLQPGPLPKPTIKAVVPTIGDELEKTGVLQLTNPFGRPFEHGLRPNVGRRIVLIELIPVDELAIDRQFRFGQPLAHCHAPIRRSPRWRSRPGPGRGRRS